MNSNIAQTSAKDAAIGIWFIPVSLAIISLNIAFGMKIGYANDMTDIVNVTVIIWCGACLCGVVGPWLPPFKHWRLTNEDDFSLVDTYCAPVCLAMISIAGAYASHNTIEANRFLDANVVVQEWQFQAFAALIATCVIGFSTLRLSTLIKPQKIQGIARMSNMTAQEVAETAIKETEEYARSVSASVREMIAIGKAALIIDAQKDTADIRLLRLNEAIFQIRLVLNPT